MRVEKRDAAFPETKEFIEQPPVAGGIWVGPVLVDQIEFPADPVALKAAADLFALTAPAFQADNVDCFYRQVKNAERRDPNVVSYLLEIASGKCLVQGELFAFVNHMWGARQVVSDES